MTRRRDLWFTLVLFLALLAVGVLTLLLQQPQQLPAHSAVSTAPNGSAALAEWLAALDYDVVTGPQPSFTAPEPDEVLVVLEPLWVFTEAEWDRVERGLETRGGRLLIVGDGLTAGAIFGHFGYAVGVSRSTVRAVLPVLAEPIFTQALTTTATLTGSRIDAVPILEAAGKPVAVTFKLGRGSVTLATTIGAFSNSGLRDPDLARLALNLATATAPRRVRFDEWHLGRRAAGGVPQQDVIGPEAWLLRTPAGQAVLFAIVLVVVALWLRGRPFGRPVPTQAERTRRAPLEYVDALAQLSRRAGHRRAAADDYHQRLKRVIGQRYRIDPGLADGEFVARVNAARPERPDNDLERLLARLSESNDEAELLRLAHTAARRLNEETRHS